MAGKKSLEFTETIQAPAAQVYQALTSSLALQNWFADFAEIDPREDGRFYAWWNTGYYVSGLITKLKENQRLAFTWQGLDEPHATRVNILLSELANATLVTISHKKLGSGKEWKKINKQIKAGWKTALVNLKSVLETGYDKRIYDQPMLGVITDAFVDEKLAKELGIPIETGCKISNAIEGMGAAAAGLQGGDVIFSINGKKLTSFPDFGKALKGIKAGDEVEVVFYRGADKHTVEMKLSGRPKPAVPKTASELAESAAKVYQQVDLELDALFEGFSDEQASMRPGTDEWSAKEVLAHLIYSERWLHLAITCHTDNQRPGGFNNDLGMHAAIANAYALDELIAELKRCEAVTIEALRALPKEFIADKRRVTILANYVSEQGFALHTRGHFPQIETALASVTKS